MKKSALILALVHALLLLPPGGWSQEEKDLPSQKTKEAIEKFKKAPAAVGQSLESLKEAGKAKLQETLQKKEAPPAKSGESVTLPEKKPEASQSPRYSAAGRRDPFQPMQLRTRATTSRPRENLSPLERFDIGQLKLVAIIWNTKEPRAMVEDNAGLGYVVKVGTPIGSNQGKVKAIKSTEVVIEEVYTDFYGAKKNRDVSMKLQVE